MIQLFSKLLHPAGAHDVQLHIPQAAERVMKLGLTPAPWKAVVYGNGILADQTDGWNVRAAQWATDHMLGFTGSAFVYWAGLFRWGENGHADALAKMNLDLWAAGASEVHYMGHSFGCRLARLASQRNSRVRWTTVTLVAAADFCDCGDGGNGWNSLLTAQVTSRLIITKSSVDTVLAVNRWWPFSGFFRCLLGLDGPTHTSSLPTVCSFSALPTQPHVPFTVAVDNTADHGNWFGKNFEATLGTHGRSLT